MVSYSLCAWVYHVTARFESWLSIMWYTFRSLSSLLLQHFIHGLILLWDCSVWKLVKYTFRGLSVAASMSGLIWYWCNGLFKGVFLLFLYILYWLYWLEIWISVHAMVFILIASLVVPALDIWLSDTGLAAFDCAISVVYFCHHLFITTCTLLFFYVVFETFLSSHTWLNCNALWWLGELHREKQTPWYSKHKSMQS